MLKNTIQIIFSLLLCTRTVFSQWDFAVATQRRIFFYDANFNEVKSAAHDFWNIKAIAFDELNERIFFSGNGSIFSLKMPFGNSEIKETIVTNTPNEFINGMAYDPLEEILYWADSSTKNIFYYPVNGSAKSEPKVLFSSNKSYSSPHGLAIDVCRRKLYWTDSNNVEPSIHMMSLNGENPMTIIKTEHPANGIVVDQLTDRIYYVVDQSDVFYKIKSAKLDGTDEQTILDHREKNPISLSVTKDKIYFTDLTAVWSVPKSNKSNGKNISPKNVKLIPNIERIVSRVGLISKLKTDSDCKDVIGKLENRRSPKGNYTTNKFEQNHEFNGRNVPDKGEIISSVELSSKLKTDSDSKDVNEKMENNFTTRKFEENHESDSKNVFLEKDKIIPDKGENASKRKPDSDGKEVIEKVENRLLPTDDYTTKNFQCHNYCIHGNCEIVNGNPNCSCKIGFTGERCETSKCNNYCMNGGVCKIANEQPSCECSTEFIGQQCSVNATEKCVPYCLLLQNNIDVDVPQHCLRICKNLHPEDLVFQKLERPDEVCRGTWNKSIIILVCGGLAGLVLIYVIIQTLRRIYKPARPRIKKTFVVQKRVSQTPLTCRPIATEQCEITIENCCNMNICDTPCFDTKLLQQNMSESNKKEDKESLINNMEEELY